MKLRFKSTATSDIGRRLNNEDAYLINDTLGLFIVADGMGGHDKGEIASWFSSKQLESVIEHLFGSGEDDTLDGICIPSSSLTREEMLRYAVFLINKKLFDENENVLNAGLEDLSPHERKFRQISCRKKSMGTTLVSLYFHKNRVFVTNIGDSRAYRISASTIQQITHDHSWVEERLREGLLDAEEIEKQKKKNVTTRSLGFKKEVQADIDILTAVPGEKFLLCSDGLSNIVDENLIFNIISGSDIASACNQLVEKAKSRGGRDNITAALIEVINNPERCPTPIPENCETIF